VRRLVDDKFSADYLGVSRSKFRAQVAAGVIPRVVVPGLRRLLVDIEDLNRLVAAWKRT